MLFLVKLAFFAVPLNATITSNSSKLPSPVDINGENNKFTNLTLNPNSLNQEIENLKSETALSRKNSCDSEVEVLSTNFSKRASIRIERISPMFIKFEDDSSIQPIFTIPVKKMNIK